MSFITILDDYSKIYKFHYGMALAIKREERVILDSYGKELAV